MRCRTARRCGSSRGSRYVVDGIVRTAYDTTELPAQPGDVLDVLEEDVQSGWLWCRNREGREGWVPVSTVTA